MQEELQRECDTWQRRAQSLEVVPKSEGTGPCGKHHQERWGFDDLHDNIRDVYVFMILLCIVAYLYTHNTHTHVYIYIYRYTYACP